MFMPKQKMIRNVRVKQRFANCDAVAYEFLNDKKSGWLRGEVWDNAIGLLTPDMIPYNCYKEFCFSVEHPKQTVHRTCKTDYNNLVCQLGGKYLYWVEQKMTITEK